MIIFGDPIASFCAVLTIIALCAWQIKKALK